MSTVRVEITIDELVLHGFQPTERYVIGEALALELERLLAVSNAAPLGRLGDIPVLRANGVNLPSGAKGQAIGAQVAGAVHASLSDQKGDGK